ncbi:MAG: hypothetical protein EOO38_12665 [Cytophagaceae bacterium]|nr:MAG: hypothetical protein EOO38_12665 [Cytophagaceae bacterium]
MSDCVLAVRSKKNLDIERLGQAILEQWDTFRTAYGGTGAPYTTLERISEILSVCIGAQKVKIAPPAKTMNAVLTIHHNIAIGSTFEDIADPRYLLAASA